MKTPRIITPVKEKFNLSFLFGEGPEWYIKIFGYPHNGIDIACSIGTPVRACDDGILTFADDITDGDGKGIIITHLWGMSLYWHLSNITVKTYQNIKKGMTIGLSGDTGYVTGPHLHFAIKVEGQGTAEMRYWVNPLNYMEEETAPPPEALPVERTHLVMPGQTLWSIAEKYYNNGTEWKRIYLANQDKIKNPNIIYPFQRFLIP